MKKIFVFLAGLLAGLHSYAQLTPFAEGVKMNALPIIYLPENVSVQFISPEPIQYVDISAKSVIGDLPLKNVLRIRIKDSISSADAVITIAGEKFMAQYHVIRADSVTARDSRTEITINPGDTRPLDISGIGLSQNQLKQLALNLFCKRPGHAIEKTKAFDLKAELYHIYTADDYVFIDLGYRNKTNLAYNIEDFRFHIDDKKITKATNVQSVELKPEFILLNNPLFQKTYRNIIVLKKMTFPGNKVLHIELSEKQISGRVITLNISYQDVLDADVIPVN
ncbi:Bacteroides conjugative transposon TraN protein [Mucilaginibacter pineti]|uniref:Bacteroides conjugative transposon TraN protein n=1 Tax=Mucilaginibacter pineti TaxID=1391627 RepID=A0A1G7G7Q1_9SPHI|nr:conjugative transposon protein TraN [Mucilaginibacter pineti]SDE84166.1 Bacteroides conjugative transposon TraN protein [Mucilaginibacter pineti]